MTGRDAAVSVVICAYTEARWNDLVAAIHSIGYQTQPALETIIVIDHNPELFDRAARFFRHFPGVVLIENDQPAGLSGARNAGIARAAGDIVAFLDDDASAEPGWLSALIAAYADPDVIGVGGAIEPAWDGGRPRWFSEEFDWVIGCTYRGMPVTRAPVRNQIGANMSFRRDLFEAIGGFRNGVGQIGASMLRCDDTEFGIRAGQARPGKLTLYEPAALVHHRVPADRARWAYFCRRCYTEGLAKAIVARLAGTRDGLASERSYASRTLPAGVARGLGDTILRGDPYGLARAGAIAAGFCLATAGYLAGTLAGRLGLSRVPADTATRPFAPRSRVAPADPGTGSSS